MISRQLFDDLMTKAVLFTGQNMKKAASDVIYDEIKANYTNKDFQDAISDIMELEQFRFNGPSIVKRLNFYRSMRHEQEAEQKRKQGEEDARKFWELQFDGKCTHHKCFSCDKVRCDDMAMATLAYIKKIVAFEPDPTLTIPEQIKQKKEYRLKEKEKLIKDFPGAGFEKEYSRMNMISIDELQGRKKKTISNRIFEPTEAEQSRWEKEYYGDDVFVPEVTE